MLKFVGSLFSCSSEMSRNKMDQSAMDRTLAYVQTVSPDQISDEVPEETPDERSRIYSTEGLAIRGAIKFIDQRSEILKKSPNRDNDVLKMYKILKNVLDERVARHVLLIKRTYGETEQRRKEAVLNKHLLGLLRKPEWTVPRAMHMDYSNHILFERFYKHQVESDLEFNKNVHQYMMDMFNYAMNLHKTSRNLTFRKTLLVMMDAFDETAARDLLVLKRIGKITKYYWSLVQYLTSKYGCVKFESIPVIIDLTVPQYPDEDIPEHPYYLEYYVAKQDIMPVHPFQFCNFYEPLAKHWIAHRLSPKKLSEGRPAIVYMVYLYLEKTLTETRAYELFVISEYRRDPLKLERLEAYISEKYRKYLDFPECKEGVVVPGKPMMIEDANFAKKYPAIVETVFKRSKFLFPLYNKAMVDKVDKVLTERKTMSLAGWGNQNPNLHRHQKLCEFLHANLTEERVREVHAMVHHNVKGWEDILYSKYEHLVDPPKDYAIIRSYAI